MVRGPSRSVTRDDVLALMREQGSSGEPWTSTELAEHLDCSSDTVYNRLRELATIDEVATKKVGARARIWWVPRREGAYHASSGMNNALVDVMMSRTDVGEAWTTTELAERDPNERDRDQIYHVLRDLEDEGVIESKNVGSRARVWWIPLEKSAPA